MQYKYESGITKSFFCYIMKNSFIKDLFLKKVPLKRKCYLGHYFATATESVSELQFFNFSLYTKFNKAQYFPKVTYLYFCMVFLFKFVTHIFVILLQQ